MAIDPVVIRFAAAGVADVSAAFTRVSEQLRKFEEQATRNSERGARSRVGVARNEEREKERAYAKLEKDVERSQRQQTKDEEREAKRRESIRRKSSELAGRYAAQQAKEEIHEAERTTRAVEREEERKLKIRRRSSELAGRAAAREAAEEMRLAERSSRGRGTFGRRVGGVIGGTVSGLAGTAASMAGATLAFGGGFAIADAARKEISFERTAAQLVNAGTTRGVVPGTVKDVAAEASVQSKALGVDRETLARAALTYSQHARGGDFKGALANMGFFAKVSTVTGADINDVATAAGTLQSQNPELAKDPGQMRQMIMNVIGQTHEGTMSMVDTVKQMGTLGVMRSAFTNPNVAMTQRSLLGAGQIVAPGKPEEAGTFVKDTVEQVLKKQDKFSAIGVKFKGGRIDMGFEEMIGQIFRGTGGDVGKMEKMLEGRGARLPLELANTFKAGSEKGGGIEGGVKAVMADLNQVSGQTMTSSQLESQFSTVMETPGAKLSKAVNALAETLQEKLEPRLEHFATDTLPKLVPVMERGIEAADKFASWFAANPMRGIGTIVLGAIMKDLASAGIGAVVRAFFATMLAKQGGFGAVGSGVLMTGATKGQVAGKLLGAAGTIAGVGGLAYMASLAIDADVATQQSAQGNRATGAAQGGALAAHLRGAGKNVSPEDLAKAQEAAAGLSKQRDELVKGPQSSWGEKIFDFLGGGEAGKIKAAENRRELEQTTASLRELQKVIAAITAAGPPGAPVPPKSTAPNVPIAGRPHG